MSKHKVLSCSNPKLHGYADGGQVYTDSKSLPTQKGVNTVLGGERVLKSKKAEADKGIIHPAPVTQDEVMSIPGKRGPMRVM